MQRGALDMERDLCKQAKEMGMASLADEWHMHVRVSKRICPYS